MSSVAYAAEDAGLPAVRVEFPKQLIIEREALMKVSHGGRSERSSGPTFRRVSPGCHPGLLSSVEEEERSREQESPR